MQINIILYGIAKDIIGESNYQLTLEDGANVRQVLNKLRETFPRLNDLTSMLIAVNDEYAKMDYVIRNDDEVVIIPPVSGG